MRFSCFLTVVFIFWAGTINAGNLPDEPHIAVTGSYEVSIVPDIVRISLNIAEASRIFQNGYPQFLAEAKQGPRVLVSVEPQHIWVKGKFVAPLRRRNELRTKILLEFFKEASASPDIRLG